MRKIIQPLAMVSIPKDWRQIEEWIRLHPNEERTQLYTAAWMAWNLAAELTKPETEHKDNQP